MKHQAVYAIFPPRTDEIEQGLEDTDIPVLSIEQMPVTVSEFIDEQSSDGFRRKQAASVAFQTHSIVLTDPDFLSVELPSIEHFRRMC